MQSIVNIATAKNTVKPAIKPELIGYTRDSIAYPVDARELFDSLKLSTMGMPSQLRCRGYKRGKDFVIVPNDTHKPGVYMTVSAARSVCERRQMKAIGAAVAERLEGFAHKPTPNADLTPIIEDVRRCVESLRNENDSLKKQLADAKNRVAALESSSNGSVAEALMRIITGAA